MQAVIGVKFIADHVKQQNEENMVSFSPYLPLIVINNNNNNNDNVYGAVIVAQKPLREFKVIQGHVFWGQWKDNEGL